jgi:hypothetical protein
MPDSLNGLPRVVVDAVEHGWSIVPVGVHKKPLLEEWAWLQTARPTREQVVQWHTELKPAGWAVVTGKISGVDVIDFDGVTGLETMRQYDVLPHVQSGSGGAHEYVAHPNFHVPTWNGKKKLALQKILPGTDLKGDGGYAIFWGRNAAGVYRRLRPLAEPDPWAGELIGKLMTLIVKPETARGVSDQQPGPGRAHAERASADDILALYLARERTGAGRNDTGLDLACQLRDNGYSEHEAAAVMAKYAADVKAKNTKGRLEPYTDAEVRATLRSAYARPPRSPWVQQHNHHISTTARVETSAGGENIRHPQAGSLITQSFREVEIKPINWLWPGRIARGKVNLIAGNPGLGKSQLTAGIAAVVSTGGRWPVDRIQATQGNVIVLSAEDDPGDTMRPRLEAAGANLARVHFARGVIAGHTGEGRQIERLFCLGRDLEALARAIQEIGSVAVVVIDPVTAYLGEIDSHRNAEVRAVLTPLAEMAAQFGTGVIAISHLNKTTGPDALMRVTGSLAFVAAARTAHLVALDPEDKGRRLFLPIKNNLAADRGGLAFRIEGATVSGPQGTIETSRVMWEAGVVALTADDVIRQQVPDEGSALREAYDWLRQILENPTPAAEVFRQAREAGITEKTLRRAAEKLHVRSQKAGMKAGWIWSISTCLEEGQTKPKLSELSEPFKDSEGSRPRETSDDSGGIAEIDL